jgi:hypothetical protein
MTHFFSGLPLWLLTVVILGLSLLVGLGFSLGIQKLFRFSPTTEQADLAIDLMQVASTYIGILLAFAGVLAWQNYDSAETAIQEEAGAASQLYRDLTVYGPDMDGSRQDLRAYINSIVKDEWPQMRDGKASGATEARLVVLFDDVAAAKPANEREAAIYQEAFSLLNNLVKLRRDRISASQADIPAVLWVVAIAGSILTLAYASAFVSSRYASLMISGTSLTIGLMFVFLLSVDNPFKGCAETGGNPLFELTSIFDSIDRVHQLQPAAGPASKAGSPVPLKSGSSPASPLPAPTG